MNLLRHLLSISCAVLLTAAAGTGLNLLHSDEPDDGNTLKQSKLASIEYRKSLLDLTAEECLNSNYLCIRVHNSTAIDFDSFKVQFVAQTEDYGTLRAGGSSPYRKVSRAYGYAMTEAIEGDNRYLLFIFDFMGEKLLENGIYTYDYEIELIPEELEHEYEDTNIRGFFSSTLTNDENSI